MTDIAPPSIDATTAMRDVLREYPGAQRALFSKYHIGGCQSCAFHPEETVAALCARNENLPVGEVIDHIVASHEADRSISIEPLELSALLGSPSPPRLIDIRTREEFEAVKFHDASFFCQDLINEAFQSWEREDAIVICDHTGERSLDAAAYLSGHGFGNVRCLRGGIDAYSLEADTSLPRYRIEAE